MTWVIVLISLTTGLVVAEIPYGDVAPGKDVAALARMPPSNDLAEARRLELSCSKLAPIKAAQYNMQHPDQQVKAVCRTQ